MGEENRQAETLSRLGLGTCSCAAIRLHRYPNCLTPFRIVSSSSAVHSRLSSALRGCARPDDDRLVSTGWSMEGSMLGWPMLAIIAPAGIETTVAVGRFTM